MVPRPNLGDDSVYTLCSVHPRLRRTSSDETTPYRVRSGVGALAPTVETPLGIEKFWLQRVPFPNPNKGFFNMVLHTLSLGSFVLFAMIGD